ncbi:aminopeptidase N [Schaalia vaccimaxillae]|uniref:aminopeptidase N n=1 Tax=Schaalia vaccimaxillae TaxID=183916 RepID=UPI0003B739C7|nr:aminopeptidase N [Schaalia vaccimaxillae]
MQMLTRDEARKRSQDLTVTEVDVDLDLSTAHDISASQYPVTSRFSLTTSSPEFFIDIAGDVEQVTVDGRVWPHEADGERVTLHDIPTHRRLEVSVSARCSYSRSGEGLHRYVDPEDQRIYLYTQFEPNDAHRAWPCFDQPDIKPRWLFRVTAPRGWVVTSNGIQESASEQGDLRIHEFSRTHPLSSYITAVVAGQWAVVDGGTWSGGAADNGHVEVPLRLMCRQALAEHMDADDILEVTRQGFDFYHRHYGVTFPWGSYDQIFVPEYNLGAMENPGCVTFNENYLSRSVPTHSERQRRANTILHEMCHMWFGDLATPAWWDDLWLKESFAENQGAYALAQATQYTSEWASFAMNRKAWAYEQDQLPTTHPIAADIADVAAAKTNFDGITYAKGAAVLKQLVAWVGEEAFFAAARQYFQTHAFSATTLADLLEALEEASGQSLDDWRDAWLYTCGPSVLSASWNVDAVGCISGLTLEQRPSEAVTSSDLRPHRVIVSTWKRHEGTLQRTHRFDIRVQGRSTLVDPERILNVPGASNDIDMVVVNDEDLTYAVSRLDELSTATALSMISSCPEAVTRAVVWASLWNAVRDGLLDPARFVRAVLVQAPVEEEAAIRDRLLALLPIAVSRFLPGSKRQELRETIMSTCAQVCARTNDEDAHRMWTRLLIEIFATSSSPSHTLDIEGLSEGPDVDLAWRARRALAARGLTPRGRLDQWLDADRSGEAQRHHCQAVASLPDAQSKAQAWNRVFSDELSNELLSATLDGLTSSATSSAQDAQRVIDGLEAFWNSHTIGLAMRYVRGGLELGLNVEDEEATKTFLDGLGQWLADHEAAQPQLRRLIIEKIDELERSQRVQKSCLP